jgi:hypothetical protein
MDSICAAQDRLLSELAIAQKSAALRALLWGSFRRAVPWAVVPSAGLTGAGNSASGCWHHIPSAASHADKEPAAAGLGLRRALLHVLMAPGRRQVWGTGRRLTVSRVLRRAELTASYAVDERVDLLFEVHSC